MNGQFFVCLILNSPYAHQALDGDWQPTNWVFGSRRRCGFITQITKPKKQRKSKDKTETARLLQHCGHRQFQGIRPLFCQAEAVETANWLTEATPKMGKRGTDLIGGISRGE